MKGKPLPNYIYIPTSHASSSFCSYATPRYAAAALLMYFGRPSMLLLHAALLLRLCFNDINAAPHSQRAMRRPPQQTAELRVKGAPMYFSSFPHVCLLLDSAPIMQMESCRGRRCGNRRFAALLRPIYEHSGCELKCEEDGTEGGSGVQ